MKKAIKYLSLGALVPVLMVTAANADTNLSCTGGLLPGGVCQTFAGAASGFTISNILSFVFDIIIGLLVIFILFQIIKAVFDWIGKSNDEKARGAAIKSITNAVIAGIVLIIALLVVILGSKALGVGNIPAVAFACYKDGTALAANGVVANSSAQEIPNSEAVEGRDPTASSSETSSNQFTAPVGHNDTNVSGLTNDQDKDTLLNKVYCRNRDTGNVLADQYVVAKRISVNK